MERYHEEAESKSVWIATGSWESEASGVNGDGERESDGAVDDEDIGKRGEEMADDAPNAIQATTFRSHAAFFAPGPRFPVLAPTRALPGVHSIARTPLELRCNSSILPSRLSEPELRGLVKTLNRNPSTGSS